MRAILNLASVVVPIRFTDKKDRPIFAIPLMEVIGATHSREREEGSFGRKGKGIGIGGSFSGCPAVRPAAIAERSLSPPG